MRHVLRTRPVIVTSVLLGLAIPQLQAQTIGAAAELDNKDRTIVRVHTSWSQSGMDLRPYLSIDGYRHELKGVRFPRQVVVPAIGVVNRLQEGTVGFAAGYAIAEREPSEPGSFFTFGGETGKGIVGIFQFATPAGAEQGVEVRTSYNFGTRFFWLQGRSMRAVPMDAAASATPDSPVWAGGEVAIIAPPDPLAGGRMYIWQFGPLAEYRVNAQLRLVGVAGLKFGFSDVWRTGNQGSRTALYGRFELAWQPLAK